MAGQRPFMPFPSPPFPGQKYDPKKLNYNPGETLPFPAPQAHPVGYWSGTSYALVWSDGTDPVVRTATWGTPVFDLRPDLRGADGREGVGVPIWGRTSGGCLYVQIEGLDTTGNDLSALQCLSVERGHVNLARNAARPPTIGTTEEVSLDLGGDQSSVILTFSPPGDGYPVRYWQITLTFNILVTQTDPVLLVVGAYY